MKTSVLISNYNYADFLPYAIESVLRQSAPAHEIIVVDDGSTDRSRDIIASYGNNVIPVLQENSGQAAAISAGYKRATGDIIMLLDADDLFHPHKIEILQDFYGAMPDANWIFHDLKEIYADKLNGDNIPVSQDITPQYIDESRHMIKGSLKYDSPATSGLSFRKNFLRDFFPMPQASSITLSDHYIKFYCLATSPGLHINEPLGLQVLHNNNLYTGKTSQKALATRARIFANTAIYLNQIAPHIEKFCNNLMGEALFCGRKAKIYPEIKAKAKSYFLKKSLKTRLFFSLKALMKYLLKRA